MANNKNIIWIIFFTIFIIMFELPKLEVDK